jgi:hypothetical protein
MPQELCKPNIGKRMVHSSSQWLTETKLGHTKDKTLMYSAVNI